MQTEDYKEAVTDIVGRLSVKARAAGIFLVFAAQRPDKDVMPMQLRSQLGNRLILKVDSAGESGNCDGEQEIPAQRDCSDEVTCSPKRAICRNLSSRKSRSLTWNTRFPDLVRLIRIQYGQPVDPFHDLDLNNNATTQPARSVVEAMLPYFTECYFNASVSTAALTGVDKPRRDAATALAKLRMPKNRNASFSLRGQRNRTIGYSRRWQEGAGLAGF